jgi:hypothetical protein
MRIVNWNCCKGKHSAKLPPLRNLKPSVAVLQESPRPSGRLAESQLWHGKNEKQGLLVLGFDGWKLEQAEDFKDDPQFFLPARVIGPRDTFNLPAVWIKAGTKRPHYFSTIGDGFELYKRFITFSPTVVIGDLNTDWYVDNIEKRFGLISAYHEFFDVEYGNEAHATLYHCWNRSRRYHFDYCFIPKSWRRRIERVRIGSYAKWTDSRLSDHCPVIVDIRERRRGN